jgi:hypothetical protein
MYVISSLPRYATLIIMLVKYVLSDGISPACVPFRFVDVIVITDHDLFWNVGQANCILKYFENMMIDHSDSTIEVRGIFVIKAAVEMQNNRPFVTNGEHLYVFSW